MAPPAPCTHCSLSHCPLPPAPYTHCPLCPLLPTHTAPCPLLPHPLPPAPPAPYTHCPCAPCSWRLSCRRARGQSCGAWGWRAPGAVEGGSPADFPSRLFKATSQRGEPQDGLYCIRNSSTKNGKVGAQEPRVRLQAGTPGDSSRPRSLWPSILGVPSQEVDTICRLGEGRPPQHRPETGRRAGALRSEGESAWGKANGRSSASSASAPPGATRVTSPSLSFPSVSEMVLGGPAEAT